MEPTKEIKIQTTVLAQTDSYSSPFKLNNFRNGLKIKVPPTRFELVLLRF